MPRLALSRKLGETIYIGDNVAVTVVQIDRGKVRLRVEAPRDVPIHRSELLDADTVAALDRRARGEGRVA